MKLDRVLNRIDENFDRAVEDLTEFVRQPSISAQGKGIQQMADLVAGRYRDLGAAVTAESYDGGNPVVFASLPGRTARTLLFYNHYDVQPPEPLEKWNTPPFEPVIKDGLIFGRGTADNKGSLVARLAAFRAFLEEYGELPVALRCMVEGEEEVGSPHLQAFVDANRERIVGDGLIWEEAAADQAGNPGMKLGNKGILSLELRAKGPSIDAHAKFGGIFPNPIWKLVWALATIRRPDGYILLPGFYDAVLPPTIGEEALYEQLAPNVGPMLRRYGLSQSFPPRSGKDVMAQLYGAPTANIDGISGGYEGPGSKTVVPSEAFVKVDFRLVVKQHPDDILRLVREHLDKQGFEDIEVTVHSHYPPSKTPLEHPFVSLVAETGLLVYGRPLTVEPTSSGSGFSFAISEWSPIPIVAIGSSYAGSVTHSPNENIRLEHFRGHMKHAAAILYALAFGLESFR